MKRTFKKFSAVFLAAILSFTSIGFGEELEVSRAVVNSDSELIEELGQLPKESLLENFSEKTTEYETKITTPSIPLVEEKVSEETPYEFNAKEGIITGYKGANPPENIIIPQTINGVKVKAIGTKAFHFSTYKGKINTQIKNVQFPEGLEYIGNWAFQGNLIESLIIPDSVVELKERAFWGNQISDVKLSENLITIGEGAFEKNKITHIELPSKLESIGENAFKENKIRHIILPEKLKKIGSNAFTFNALNEIEIPDSVNDLPVKGNGILWRSNAEQKDDVQKFTKVYTKNNYVTDENTQGIVNPGSVILNYVSESGKELKSPITIVGRQIKSVEERRLVDSDSRYLQDYNTPSNHYIDYKFTKELSQNYFKMEKQYKIEADEIPGYITPEPVTIKLEKENTVKFVYSFAGTKKLTLKGDGLSSSESGDIGINAQVKITIIPPIGKKIETFKVNNNNMLADIKYKELEYSYNFKIQDDTAIEITYIKDDKNYDEEFNLQIDKTKFALGDKAKLSLLYRGEAVEISKSGINWTATPQDILNIDSNTGEVTALKSGTVILTGMLKNRSDASKSFEINVQPFVAKVRVEANNKTIAPLDQISINNLDLKKYNIDTKFTEPKPIHAIIHALEKEGIDCKDSKKGIDHGRGSYIKMIDGLKTGSTSRYDGWMYYVNNSYANMGVGDFNIKSGDSITVFFTEDYTQNYFSWFDKESADVELDKEVVLNLSGTFYDMNKNETKSGAVVNATILVDNEAYKVDGENLKTDENGNVTLKFSKTGTFKISAEKKNEKTGRRIITRPYCEITVNETAQENNISLLSDLIKTAENIKNDISVSIDGTDVAENKTWITQKSMTNYKNAIVEAKNILSKANLQKKELNSAIDSLNKAINIFKADCKLGTMKEVEIEKDYKKALDESLKYIGSNTSDLSLSDEWSILAMARGEYPLSKQNIDIYLKNIESSMDELESGTDYSRVILAMTSLGKDVENIAGSNLLEKLSDYDFIKQQGINGPIFALISSNSYNYEIPVVAGDLPQNSKDKMINYILEKEVSGGGWTLFGTKADPDISAMAIQALAPYYKQGNKSVVDSVDRALLVLGKLQKSDGDYESWGNSNPESGAQILVALCEIGKDPLDEKNGFIKENKTLLDGILKYYVEGGGFKHFLKENKANSMATDQCTYGLVAYDRFVNQKTSFYDMTDTQFSVDKTELNENIKIADSKQMSNYTSDSWQAMQLVYQKAVKAEGNQSLKQGKINEITKELKESLESLVERVTEKPLIQNGKVIIPKDDDKNFEIQINNNEKTEITIPTDSNSKITIKVDNKKPMPQIIILKGNNKLEIAQGTTIKNGSGDIQVFGVKTELEKTVIQKNIKTLLEQTDKNIKSVKIEEALKFGNSQKIDFDDYVEIVFAGMAGKNVAYIDNSQIYKIQKLENKDLANGQNEYSYDSGNDLIVKTKSFTDFVLYTEEKKTPTNDGNSGNDNTQKTVTISIDKKTINKGYVVSPIKVKISKGESVWDVTKRVMDTNFISYKYNNNSTYGSVYIESIAGDGEFDQGETSGWMYSVNGEYPNYGSSSFNLSGDETIQWRYTTNLGQDLGQDNSSWGSAGGGVIPTNSDNLTSTVIKPQAKVIKGEAKAEIDHKTIENMLKKSQENKLSQLVIEPKTEIKEAVDSMAVVFEKISIEKIALSEKTSLKIKTVFGDIIVSNNTLKELAKQKVNTITMTVRKNKTKGTDFEIKSGLNIIDNLENPFIAVLPIQGKVTDSTVAVEIMTDSSKKILMKSIVESNQIKTKLSRSATISYMQNEKLFSDIENHWALSAIEFTSSREILKGTQTQKFSPDEKMTKAMIITLLHRFDDEKQTKGDKYADVKPSAYYEKSSLWARQNKIIQVSKDNKFQGDTKITREELANMIYNYAKYSGENVSNQDAVQYCVSRGILVGKNEKSLNLQDATTRAEVSAIIQRYVAQTLK